MAAAVATFDILAQDHAAIYERISAAGSALMNGIRERAVKLGVPLLVQGHPSIFYVAFPAKAEDILRVTDYRSSLNVNNELYSEFVCALADKDVRIIPRGNWFLSAAHTETEVQQTLAAVEEALAEIAVPHYAGVLHR